ncbi:hypothetical protein A6U85_02435 [Agrobacterium sp. 13-626]|nr:hypothetical protein DXT98_05670 [Agrobacterium sp. ICMP 7243]KEA06536.1 hypothetical protein CN09_05985 [Rhizobium rhizogenes]OCJ05853.1 hypothetical protein A6U85_02435 [Agrobacterium sp. 13-626]OCJ25940.1 hypothetical protein A6U88_05775 [Agrobacterium sp. B131/95]OCJ30962.1 hypothetical protein A6U89_00720 [Agrobacterium sp. B133/95]
MARVSADVKRGRVQKGNKRWIFPFAQYVKYVTSQAGWCVIADLVGIARSSKAPREEPAATSIYPAKAGFPQLRRHPDFARLAAAIRSEDHDDRIG